MLTTTEKVEEMTTETVVEELMPRMIPHWPATETGTPGGPGYFIARGSDPQTAAPVGPSDLNAGDSDPETATPGGPGDFNAGDSDPVTSTPGGPSYFNARGSNDEKQYTTATSDSDISDAEILYVQMERNQGENYMLYQVQ